MMRNIYAITRREALAGLGTLAWVLSAPRALRAETLPMVTVTKDPSCGCCGGWVEHVKAAGFPVQVRESDDMTSVKARLGVPMDLASCHTAEVDGYVIEGHVPAAGIKRLLAKRPVGVGLAVPGMPAGSPGMDFAGVAPEPYEVLLFDASGHSLFLRFLGAEEV